MHRKEFDAKMYRDLRDVLIILKSRTRKVLEDPNASHHMQDQRMLELAHDTADYILNLLKRNYVNDSEFIDMANKIDLHLIQNKNIKLNKDDRTISSVTKLLENVKAIFFSGDKEAYHKARETIKNERQAPEPQDTFFDKKETIKRPDNAYRSPGIGRNRGIR